MGLSVKTNKSVLFNLAKAVFSDVHLPLSYITMSNSELACVYAALILQDDGLEISGDNLTTLIKAADVECDSYWPGLFAKALDGIDIKALVSNVGAGGGAPAAAGGAAAGGEAAAEEAPAEEAKKEESEEEESDDDMGFGLFD